MLLRALALGVVSVSAVDIKAQAISQELVDSINAAKPGWTAGINEKFADISLAEATMYMGTITSGPGLAASRAKLSKGDGQPLKGAAPPVNFDTRTAWPQCASISGHIRDQSSCGSCWAFGSTEALNDRLCITHGYTGLLSPQDTASCCDGNQGCDGSAGCDGGFPSDAWSYFVKYGVVTGGDYDQVNTSLSCYPYQLPFCSHHEAGQYPPCPSQEYQTPSCPIENGKGCSNPLYAGKWATDKHHAVSGYSLNSVNDAMADLVARGSITASFEVYQDFLTYKSGIYTHQSGPAMGGHAVKIIGYGTDATSGQDYWLVVNSWNSGWGNGGTFMIAKGINECGIEEGLVAGQV